MTDIDLPANAIALACDVACLAGVRARPQSVGPITLLCGSVALIGPSAYALVATPGLFGPMRAACFTLFLHAPIVLLAGAALARDHARIEAIVQSVIAALLVLVGIDAFVVEPRWLEVARYTVASPKLDEPLRIVVLSDVQTDAAGSWEAGVFERAMEEKPDLIVLPGDFIQVDVDLERYPGQVEAIRRLWPTLQAPLGVWAVQGNVDWRETWASDLFGGTQITADRATTTRDLGPVSLTSVSFKDGFDIDVAIAPTDDFHIAFAHGPDFSRSPNVHADLLIAGHTHGGQVVLPFFGPPMTLTTVPREQAKGGLSELSGGRRLVVSRGVGMERAHAPRLRFLCRPQLVVIDLVPG